MNRWMRQTALLLIVMVPSASHAWNKAGHMLTGAIAYQVLKADGDDKTIARVTGILAKHPDFAAWDKAAQKLPKDDRDLYLFMHAARWPDDARDDPEFYPPDAHFDKLHYINLPYKPMDQPDSVKTVAPDDLNIFRAYPDKLAALKKSASAADRAVALCWVAHLVGDVHQPLHTTSLFTTQFPRGDRGGTIFFIRAKEGKFPISLHKYWDDLLLSSQNTTTVKNYAIELRNRQDFAKPKLTELADTSFQDWATKESLAIAKSAVYRDGALKGNAKQGEAPALPEDYAKAVQPIAERRAVLAGYRLAAVLKSTLE